MGWKCTHFNLKVNTDNILCELYWKDLFSAYQIICLLRRFIQLNSLCPREESVEGNVFTLTTLK